MSEEILVHLRLFANARDVIGMSSVDMVVPVGTDIETLKNLILEKYQIPEKKFSGLIFSRNHVFVEKTTVLADQDEIGVFPSCLRRKRCHPNNYAESLINPLI